MESSLSPSSSCDLQISPLFLNDNPKKCRLKRSLKPTLCVVCENEPSTVSYFNIRICTGCRAFFRRSVKCQKTYQCLNNDLCGNGKEISNRLACKFCRFQRCINCGMLDKKLQLHSDHAVERKEHHLHSDSSFPLIQLNVFIQGNMAPILSELTLLRRKITYERYLTYHGKETKITSKEAKSGLHDWLLGLYEYDLLNNAGKRCEKLFAQIDNEDWEELLTADYSMIFTIFSHVQATIRNQGHDDMRIYLTDESFFWVSEENSGGYWHFICENINGDNKAQLYNIVRSYFLGVATNLVTTVCRAVARARLDEAEIPSSLLVLSDKTRNLLRQWRNETLAGVSEHIERTGRNVDERLSDIIFLMNEFQNLVILARNAINLSLASTENTAIPQKFIDLISRSNNRRLKSNIMRIFGDLVTN
ncbi:Retinoic acid receptor RXR-alpha-A-like isoform X4 [Aphelenchoides bicaudatus]|nr:Retinoic acid receptor RXR-alpha-A-like isoform X4 [Aphelenchoides bicaudatus]